MFHSNNNYLFNILNRILQHSHLIMRDCVISSTYNRSFYLDHEKQFTFLYEQHINKFKKCISYIYSKLDYVIYFGMKEFEDFCIDDSNDRTFFIDFNFYYLSSYKNVKNFFIIFIGCKRNGNIEHAVIDILNNRHVYSNYNGQFLNYITHSNSCNMINIDYSCFHCIYFYILNVAFNNSGFYNIRSMIDGKYLSDMFTEKILLSNSKLSTIKSSVIN